MFAKLTILWFSVLFLASITAVNGQAPTITSFAPLSGPIGTSVNITGTSFSTTPANNIVFFGATQAAVTAATTTQLTVTVPAGATFKPITVLVGGLIAYSSSRFLVTFAGGGTIDNCAFAPKVDFPPGPLPASIILIDLDGDGKSDMVMSNGSSNIASAYRNISTSGNPNFETRLDFATGTYPDGIAVGDLDGDGKPDLASANNNANTVSILRNTSTPGTISFAAKVDYAVGVNARRIALGDIDGDGKLELIVPNNFTKLSVFQNQSTPGTISFAAKVDFTVYGAGFFPWTTTVGDVDGDGKPDVVVAIISGGNHISILRNTSTLGVINAASFAPFVTFVTGNGPYDVEIVDLDGDLKPDITTVNLGANSISVLRNTSTPGVIDATTLAAKVDFTTGVFPNNLTIDDLDGDGKPDIGVARNQTTSLSVHKNTATPGVIDASSFAPFVNFATGTASSVIYDIAAGDLDGDGKPDLALTSNKVGVLINTVGLVPTPTITSFNPTFGLPGVTVTITGTNFSTTPASNIVTFNGTTAAVSASSATSITTTVPVGATTGKITVLIGCPTATSATNFIVGTCLPATERAALIALYNSTGGVNWTNKTNWLSLDESTWYGVTVTGCHVTSLALGLNHLVGSLPTQIGDLPFLMDLDLSKNNLSSNIPDEIGDLSNLQTLNLETNALSGTIPATVGNLTSLDFLSLSSNLLDGDVPTALAVLPLLTTVKLTLNNFISIPPFSPAQVTQLAVEFNSLDFGDLQPNIGVPGFTYNPQAQLPPGGYITFVSGSTVTIPFTTPGTGNSYQWYKHGTTPIAGAISPNLVIPNATSSDVDFYVVHVTSSVVPGITLTSFAYNLAINPCPTGPRSGGDIDPSFDPLINNPATVSAVELQSTGKIIVSAPYSDINSTIYQGIIRFNSDGSLDNTFVTNSYTPYANQLIVQPDDKIIGIKTGTYSYVIRLNADGSDDAAFNSNVNQNYNTSMFAVALQPDGKILYSYNDNYTGIYLERINTDGTFDNSFSAPQDIAFSAIKVQSDGFILAGGSFSEGILRLDATGAIDPTFDPGEGANGEVIDIVVQPDGKIILVGSFTSFNDNPHRGIVRLNSDGSEDNTFQGFGIFNTDADAGTPIQPNKVLLQADGKILVAGDFHEVNFAHRNSIVRLNTDGSVDCNFDPDDGPDAQINDMALQTDQKILITGDFSDYDDTGRNGLARVKNGGGTTINITAQPIDATVCDGVTATFSTTASGTTNITYHWQFSPNGPPAFVDITNGANYSGATTNTLLIITTGTFGAGRYRCRIDGDLAPEVFTNDEGLFINPAPSAPGTTGDSGCGPLSLTLTATGGVNGDYRWYTVPTAGTALIGEVNDTYVTPLLSATTTYYVSLSNGTCESTRTSVIATVNIVAKPVVVTSNCTSTSATLTGPAGFTTYAWSDGEGTSSIIVTNAGTFTLIVTDGNGCNSPLSDPVTFTAAFCNQAPEVTVPSIQTVVEGRVDVDLLSLISDADNNVDLTTLQIVSQPISGAPGSIDASHHLIVDYAGVSFSGTDRLTIQVCDFSAACTPTELTIEVAGDITIYNAVSANGDSKNEVFYIQYIDLLPNTKNNRVTIYNRWGDNVFETQDYDNATRAFRGLSRSGDPLPPGTYYYKIDFLTTSSSRTGFISLKR